jgi:hypothetical protein
MRNIEFVAKERAMDIVTSVVVSIGAGVAIVMDLLRVPWAHHALVWWGIGFLTGLAVQP